LRDSWQTSADILRKFNEKNNVESAVVLTGHKTLTEVAAPLSRAALMYQESQKKLEDAIADV
jgi:hypothetical protein